MKHKKDHVDIITVNYNGETIIPQLFDSLRNITYPHHSTLMVDNASTDNSVALTQEQYPEVLIHQLQKNHFFRANNFAIERTSGEFILLVNTDIIVEPDFLEHMVTRIKTDKKIAAVASKMLLEQDRRILDSVGTLILDNGSSFNRGIGQPDVGQYDTSEQTFGACFGCVLIRRSHWEGEVGGLDPRYFGYYEDIDWCYRANILGYKIITEPKAVVYHAHSVTSRKKEPLWKLFLIHRNFLYTTIKNVGGFRAFKIVVVHLRDMLKLKKNHSVHTFAWMYLKVFFSVLFMLPNLLYKRLRLQRQRKVTDTEIWKFAEGEGAYFDDVKYEPLFTIDSLKNVVRKLAEKNNKFEKLNERVKNYELRIVNDEFNSIKKAKHELDVLLNKIPELNNELKEKYHETILQNA